MCDTFVSTVQSPEGRRTIFGKNSDREPNEAQALEYHHGRSHPKSDTLSCTYISIPQSARTLDTIISRPFWMWGAEMGANEKGVVIGNEAVFTRMPYRKTGGLTGMDMLRLALERAETAQTALETIVQLLYDFGQGGICGYQDRKLTYHNSFLICDPRESWVLETADYLWVAARVKDSYAISNRLTIGEDFDLSHAELIPHARRKGWLKKGADFNFAETYSDWLYTTFSGSNPRLACSTRLLSAADRQPDLSAAMRILRNHGDRHASPDGALIATGLCMHAGNGLTRNSQTTGSLIACLTESENQFWATATAAPCTSLYKPLWFGDPVLPDLGPAPSGEYDPDSFWWRHERLHRAVMSDFSRIDSFMAERDKLEQAFIARASTVERNFRYALTEEAFRRSDEAEQFWFEQLRNLPLNRKPGWLFRQYWQKQNRNSGMNI